MDDYKGGSQHTCPNWVDSSPIWLLPFSYSQNPVLFDIPAVDDPKLECARGCQDTCNGQDPYDEGIRFLATCSGPVANGPFWPMERSIR
jgi:hypothetical protein